MEMIFSMVALHRLHNSMSVFLNLSESQHCHFLLRIPPDRFTGLDNILQKHYVSTAHHPGNRSLQTGYEESP